MSDTIHDAPPALEPGPRLTFHEYSTKAMSTAHYDTGADKDAKPMIYPALKLNGEAGEVAEAIGKVWRGDYGDVRPADLARTDWHYRLSIICELGDVLWYIAAVARDAGSSLEEVARTNNEKLRLRREFGKDKGMEKLADAFRAKRG